MYENIIFWYEGDKEWSCLDHTLVQILVVVASSQVRTLTADVRKGFNAIVLSIEWADLKTSPNWSIRVDFIISLYWLKRKQVKIPVHGEELLGVTLVILSGYVKVT